MPGWLTATPLNTASPSDTGSARVPPSAAPTASVCGVIDTAGQPRRNVARPLVAAGAGTVPVSRGVDLAACAGPQTTLARSLSGGTDWRTIATLPTFRPVALLNTAGADGTPAFWP